jgi:hypothetical protein
MEQVICWSGRFEGRDGDFYSNTANRNLVIARRSAHARPSIWHKAGKLSCVASRQIRIVDAVDRPMLH